MNLELGQPRNETEEILLSITKDFEMKIKQAHTKPQELLEFKLTINKKNFFI